MNYTLEDLRALKKKWYKNAEKSGIFTKITFIGRELGDNLHEAFGPKYRFSFNGLTIYVDNYGGFFDVSYKNRLVCNPSKKLFVPGEWTKQIDKLFIEANEKNKVKKEAEEQRLIKKLARELMLED